jgi:type 1 fimbria pilin
MKKKSLLVIAMMIGCLMMVASAAWAGGAPIPISGLNANNNGTVTVNGLVWLKDAGCLGKMRLRDASSRVASLATGQCGLSDKSTAGQWRLPTNDELKTIYLAKGSFSNVQPDVYHACPQCEGAVNMKNGHSWSIKSYMSVCYVWPVRSGP